MYPPLPDLPPALRVDEHGVVRVGPTRVTLDTLKTEYDHGEVPAAVVLNFPTLALADVEATFAYFEREPEAVAAYLHAREVEAEAIRAENERRFPSKGLRAKLLKRKARREQAARRREA
jgi:hypothetical protein